MPYRLRKSMRHVMAQPDLHLVRADGRFVCATDIALTAATPLPRYFRSVANLSLRASFSA
jgi:hypothetical protein